MLNPAGDAHDAGRTLSDGFERGVTRQFAEKLKKSLITFVLIVIPLLIIAAIIEGILIGFYI